MQKESSGGHELTQVEEARAHPHGAHDRGLLAIGLFKLAKAIFFFCVGVGAIRFACIRILKMRCCDWRRGSKFDPESRFVALVLGKVDLIDGAQAARD